MLLLQDVHLNAEAQTNLAHILQRLIATEQIGAMGIEGAFEKFDFSRFRAAPDKAHVRRVSDEFLNKNRIAAHTFVNVTSDVAPPLTWGVDDPLSYEANVQAYLDAMAIKGKVSAELEKKAREFESQKDKELSVELKRIQDARSAYHAGLLGLGPYIGALMDVKHSVPFLFQEEAESFSISLSQFMEALKMETSLDYKRVEAEREVVLSKLADVLSEKEMGILIGQSLAYKMGRLSFGDFYHHLKTTCEEKGVSLRRTPHFDSYIRYVLLADGIKAKELFADVTRLETSLAKALIRNEAERSLMEEGEWLSLAGKLLNFELTPEEWERYRTFTGDPSRVGGGGNNHGSLVNVGHRSRIDQRKLLPFERFYEQADLRSQKMVEKLISEKSSHPDVQSTALITGGFHTPEVAALLKDRGVSHVIVSPRLTQIDGKSGSDYLSIFAREKTPLEKLFAGRTLFISPHAVQVVGGVSRQPQASLANVQSQAAKGRATERAYARALGVEPVKPLVVSPLREVGFRLIIPLSQLLSTTYAFELGVLAWVFGSLLFAWFHSQHTLNQKKALVFIGMCLGLPFFLPFFNVNLSVFDQTALSIMLHSIHNFAVLKRWLPAWWPMASSDAGETANAGREKASFIQIDPAVRNHLDALIPLLIQARDQMEKYQRIAPDIREKIKIMGTEIKKPLDGARHLMQEDSRYELIYHFLNNWIMEIMVYTSDDGSEDIRGLVNTNSLPEKLRILIALTQEENFSKMTLDQVERVVWLRSMSQWLVMSNTIRKPFDLVIKGDVARMKRILQVFGFDAVNLDAGIVYSLHPIWIPTAGYQVQLRNRADKTTHTRTLLDMNSVILNLEKELAGAELSDRDRKAIRDHMDVARQSMISNPPSLIQFPVLLSSLKIQVRMQISRVVLPARAKVIVNNSLALTELKREGLSVEKRGIVDRLESVLANGLYNEEGGVEYLNHLVSLFLGRSISLDWSVALADVEYYLLIRKYNFHLTHNELFFQNHLKKDLQVLADRIQIVKAIANDQTVDSSDENIIEIDARINNITKTLLDMRTLMERDGQLAEQFSLLVRYLSTWVSEAQVYSFLPTMLDLLQTNRVEEKLSLFLEPPTDYPDLLEMTMANGGDRIIEELVAKIEGRSAGALRRIDESESGVLMLPWMWRRIPASVRETLWFRSLVVPIFEFWGLPGFALLFNWAGLGVVLGSVGGGVLFAFLHGLRAPPARAAGESRLHHWLVSVPVAVFSGQSLLRFVVRSLSASAISFLAQPGVFFHDDFSTVPGGAVSLGYSVFLGLAGHALWNLLWEPHLSLMEPLESNPLLKQTVNEPKITDGRWPERVETVEDIRVSEREEADPIVALTGDYIETGIWRHFPHMRSLKVDETEGWKFHVVMTEQDADQVLRAVLPILSQAMLHHKVINNVNNPIAWAHKRAVRTLLTKFGAVSPVQAGVLVAIGSSFTVHAGINRFFNPSQVVGMEKNIAQMIQNHLHEKSPDNLRVELLRLFKMEAGPLGLMDSAPSVGPLSTKHAQRLIGEFKNHLTQKVQRGDLTTAEAFQLANSLAIGLAVIFTEQEYQGVIAPLRNLELHIDFSSPTDFIVVPATSEEALGVVQVACKDRRLRDGIRLVMLVDSHTGIQKELERSLSREIYLNILFLNRSDYNHVSEVLRQIDQQFLRLSPKDRTPDRRFFVSSRSNLPTNFFDWSNLLSQLQNPIEMNVYVHLILETLETMGVPVSHLPNWEAIRAQLISA